MPHNTSTLPLALKMLAVVIGSIFALILSGDIEINEDGKARLNINLMVGLKLLISIGLGYFIGEFTVNYFNFSHSPIPVQGTILMLHSIFGMLVLGMVYRSFQLTFTDKTLHELIVEIKKIVRAILK